MTNLGTFEGLEATAHPRISAVCETSWRTLAGPDQPYLDPIHLGILEETQLVGEAAGTIPHYVTLRDAEGILRGAAPVFLKTHSHGELGIDWGLPMAHERAVGPYFPKLTLEVPLNPWPGPRLLVPASQNGGNVRRSLLQAIEKLAEVMGAKSIQIAYGTASDQAAAVACGFFPTETLTFTWRSQGEQGFGDFKALLSKRGRQRLRQEYESRISEGLVFRRIDGLEITPEFVSKIYAMYCHVFEQHAHKEWLSKVYFDQVIARMSDATEFLGVWDNDEPIAGLLCFRGDQTVYAQHWVTNTDRSSLLFALMFFSYQEAIVRGFSAVDYGTIGAHKALRAAAPEPLFHAFKFANNEFHSLAKTVLAKRSAATRAAFGEFARQVPYKDKRLAN